VNGKSVVHQKTGGTATVGHGQVDTSNVVTGHGGRPMIVIVKPLLTCAGKIDWIFTIQHRLRHATVPRRPTTQKVEVSDITLNITHSPRIHQRRNLIFFTELMSTGQVNAER